MHSVTPRHGRTQDDAANGRIEIRVHEELIHVHLCSGILVERGVKGRNSTNVKCAVKTIPSDLRKW